jgi:hypothetical protein
MADREVHGRDARAIGERPALDLDHLGPLVAEQAGGLGAEHDDAEVEHAQAFQWATHGAGVCCHGRVGRIRACVLGEQLVVVLAELRRAATGPETATVDLGEARGRVGRDRTRELGAGDGAAGTEVLGREHVGGRQDRRDRHPARLALQRQLVLVALAEVLLEGRMHAVGRKRPATNRLELGILKVLGLTEPRAHRMPLARREQDDPHVAIAAAEDRIRTGRGAVACLRVARDLRGAHGPHGRVDRLRGRLVQREVDVVAPAALQPVPVRDQRCPRRLHRRDLQRHVSRRHQRLPARQAGPAQHAAHRQQGPVRRHPVAVGAGEAEVRDGEHDQARVPRTDDVGRQQHSGLDPDVGPVQQAQQPLTTLRTRVVEHDAALPRVVGRESQAHAIVQWRLRPRRGAARWLDPDDVRPEV